MSAQASGSEPSEPSQVPPPVDQRQGTGRLGGVVRRNITSARNARLALMARRAAISAERRQSTNDPWGHLHGLDDSARPTIQTAETTRAVGEQPSEAEGAVEFHHPSNSLAEPFLSQRNSSDEEDPDQTPPVKGHTEAPGDESRFGVPGAPLNDSHPFVVGFWWGLGALVAYWLMTSMSHVSSVLILLVTALFLALALDPLVRIAERRGLRRGPSVAIVFLGAAALIVGFFFSVLPSLFAELGQLAVAFPRWLNEQQHQEWFQRLDQRYDIGNRVAEEMQSRLTNSDSVIQLFGGVLGAGQALVSGAFSVFAVLVLTLYLLVSLPSLQQAAFQLAPRSRRARVRALGDEIIRRIGGYTAGQITIASLNAVLSYVLIRILDLPFALVLSVLVGILGLIPMVGATLGAAIVVTVALFHSWQYAVITLIYYVIYQQVENYVIAPKVMSRTVQVPGFIAVTAAMVGAALFGVFGALIAIPIAAGILLIIQEVVLPRQERL